MGETSAVELIDPVAGSVTAQPSIPVPPTDTARDVGPTGAPTTLWLLLATLGGLAASLARFGDKRREEGPPGELRPAFSPDSTRGQSTYGPL